MTEFVTVRNGDVEIETAVAGEGPLILCVHGWPELWYSWRHQMTHFAGLGFTVAAMNVRGYGGSSNPRAVEEYTLSKICGDAASVIDELGRGEAIVFGHDWGAPIAWNTARFHADRVRAVVGLSVPYAPIGPDNPLERWREMYVDQGKFFYQSYFADNVGGAEEELGADTLDTIRKIYYAACGAARTAEGGIVGLSGGKPAGAKLLDGLADPDPFPSWASDHDLQVFADGIDRGGWHGPLNRYRAQPLDAIELGSRPDPNIKQPAAFIGGELDGVRNFLPGIDLYDYAGLACDDFRGTTIIDGAGHWVQQEAPEATNDALEAFVTSL